MSPREKFSHKINTFCIWNLFNDTVANIYWHFAKLYFAWLWNRSVLNVVAPLTAMLNLKSYWKSHENWVNKFLHMHTTVIVNSNSSNGWAGKIYRACQLLYMTQCSFIFCHFPFSFPLPDHTGSRPQSQAIFALFFFCLSTFVQGTKVSPHIHQQYHCHYGTQVP